MMPLLLFHGTEILSFLAGALLGIAVLPGIFIWIFSRPPTKPAVPAILYLLLAVASCTIFMFADSLNADSPVDPSILLLLTVAVCFPWSIILVILSGILGVDLGMGTLFLGAVLNAIFIYWIAKIARRRLDFPSKGLR
jgi:hypothetical protein